MAADLPYSKEDRELADSSLWLEQLMDSGMFKNVAKKFLTSREP
ncbi:hypothetical protein Murru_0573 [Allomuricauda ruestringensis DSM 13258]|uniref:Uncharacterized protein n=1 Tax=Allomuricauda ruestringensis (strain DSM 13258 / CIP 107369 / LMG 19739 / B1) TaxID=886377 RepID=G2PS34_ALLRU|nr:hypothetical protein [Allomuricauda ruestringensis]AEM69624.1 hypothetical protein Murru_0573 [Allomuricauda ruestringensis DSM 13258]